MIPNDFIRLAEAKGFNADTKAGEIVSLLKELSTGWVMDMRLRCYASSTMDRKLVISMLARMLAILIKATLADSMG